jgi:Flp pilus assembly protein TadD
MPISTAGSRCQCYRGRPLLETALVGLLAVSLPGLGIASDKDDKPSDTYTNVGAGEDPQAFADVAKMYGIVRGDVCNAALDAVTDVIMGGATPEGNAAAALLPPLQGCMTRDNAQRAMERWVEMAAVLVRAPGASGTPSGLAEANRLYRAGDLESAIPAYRRVLQSFPGHLDARNNLGVASLHMGNDAAAQLHLEIVHRLEPTYVPALANLTVLYERLGLRARAAAAAREALKAQQGFPPTIYNAAWFAHESEDYDTAASLLASILPMKANPLDAQLNDVNEKMRQREQASVVMDEEFDDAHRGWKLWPQGTNYDTTVENGSYVMETKNDKCSLEVIHPGFELPESFDVQVRSVWKSGVNSSAYGPVLGLDRDHQYQFAVSGNGQSVVIDSEPSAPDPCGWQVDSAAVGDGEAANWQVVQVRGRRVQYLVNGRPIVAFESRYRPTGTEWIIGVRVCRQQRVAFDRLRIVKR